MDIVTNALNTLKSEVPGLCINLNTALSKKIEDDSIVAFNDCDTLTCKHTLSEYSDTVWGLEVYMLDGKQFMVSVSNDKMVKLWDMSSNTLAATLVGHDKKVYALASFEKNRVQMLVSGGVDKIIKLWDLSTNTNIHTIPSQKALLFH